MALRSVLRLGEAVRAALQDGRPIVALESTIITHGLPKPINYETAAAAEAAVRNAGAEPATIALFDGAAHVGLTHAQLERIADSEANTTIKASRANIAAVLAKGRGYVGGTTVSGTMALAHLAGIRVFATGGIGGVHRGGENSMDVSADLTELGRTPVAVFSSGAKSILDIPRTLEYLETQGVPVFSLNPSGEFPSFYTAASGHYVPSVSGVQEAARAIALNQALGLQNGMLFGVPIPPEFEEEGRVIQQAVEVAVKESVDQGIDRQGKLATPWLLRRVSQLAKESVKSNIGLMLNNARTAAECAVELSAVLKEPMDEAPKQYGGATLEAHQAACEILVMGCSAVDITAQRTSEPALRSTAPGQVSFSLGGVAQNVARAAHAMAPRPDAVVLAAPCNPDDALGQYMQAEMERRALRRDALVHVPGGRTAVCNLLLDAAGDLETGIADMQIVEAAFSGETIERVWKAHATENLAIVAADANMAPAALARLAALGDEANVPVLFEPTSVAKSVRLVEALLPHDLQVQFATPNVYELAAMAEQVPVSGTAPPAPRSLLDGIPQTAAEKIVQDAQTLSVLVRTQFIKLGAYGVLLAHRTSDALTLYHIPPIPLDPSKPHNSTGAGDTFTGAILAGISARSHRQPKSEWSRDELLSLIDAGQQAAVHTLYSAQAVAPTLPRFS